GLHARSVAVYLTCVVACTDHDLFSRCLFEVRAVPRHLHSFPTRRSSDLAEQTRHAAGERLDDIEVRGGRVHRHAGAAAAQLIERSEEHTSELQSRENLVCRLLLEKKKQKDQGPNCPAARSRRW